jgi:hypothetical protein
MILKFDGNLISQVLLQWYLISLPQANPSGLIQSIKTSIDYQN